MRRRCGEPIRPDRHGGAMAKLGQEPKRAELETRPAEAQRSERTRRGCVWKAMRSQGEASKRIPPNREGNAEHSRKRQDTSGNGFDPSCLAENREAEKRLGADCSGDDLIRQCLERHRNGIAENRTDATSSGMAMNGADGDELTGNGMAARHHEMTRAEMAWNGAAERSHGKAKNGAHGRSCGIAQLGTDHQGDGEAAMGHESKRIERLLNGKAKIRVEPSSYGIDQRREVTEEMGSESRGAAAERLGVERTRGD